MKLIDHLDKKQREKLELIKKPNKHNLPKKKKNQKKENWVELMGMNRDIYKRGKGGAIRKK